MASFAELNSNNVVLRVNSIHNNEILENGVENEQKGINFLKGLYGQDTIWKQTSYNTLSNNYYITDSSSGERTLHVDQSKCFRKHYAMIGGVFDTEENGFIPSQPFASWSFNKDTWGWIPPVTHPNESDPTDTLNYEWNEEELRWDLVPSPT